MVYKILKKTHLNGIIYKFVKATARKNNGPSRPIEAYFELLKEAREDYKRSCIINREEKDVLYDLAIIIPAYNVETHIKRCIDSILTQKTEYSFHIYAINDGSTDNTLKILNSITDDRITVIDSENGGVSKARNIGLNIALGSYIMFVDSDDYLPVNAVEVLMSCGKKQNADIVEGSYEMFSEGCYRRNIKHRDGRVSDTNELFGFAWGKIFKAELFKNIQFNEGYNFEDSICRHIIYPISENIYTVSDIVYCYRINQSGISHNSLKNYKSVDSLWITIQLFNDRKNLNIAIDQTYVDYLLKLACLTHRRNINHDKVYKEALFYAYCDFLGSNLGTISSKNKKELCECINKRDYKLFSLYSKLF